MFVRNPEKNMDVEHITAGTQIAASGADIGIEDILQREDADDLLTITPNGVREDVPIQNLHIGNIRTNSGSGVRFEHLWLENGDVTVSQGKLFVDKLHVLNKATFSNGMMTTDVFGTAPVYDPAVSSAYWNDINKNRPQDHLDEWLSKASSPRWTYLRFYGQSRTQFSNGNLLNLQDHYYVYRERYTQTDWLRMNTDHEPYNFYETYYHPALSYHERYNLLDTSDLLSWHPDQAESSEIDVDA